MMGTMVYGSWLLIAALPAGVVALAVWLDQRTRRGYALGLLAVVLLALDGWGAVAIAQATEQADATNSDNLAFAFGVVIYLLIGLYLTLVLVVGGIALAMRARHWRWAACLAAVSLVTAVVILGPGTARVPDVLGAIGLSRGVEFLVLLVLPVLATLAYASTRILRPLGPRSVPGRRYRDT